MKLILLRGGYVPIAIGPAERLRYLDALEHASVREEFGPHHGLLRSLRGATLDTYLAALREGLDTE